MDSLLSIFLELYPIYPAYVIPGVALLIVVQTLAPLLGILQENVADTFGRHPNELLFYSHLFALPCSLVFLPQLIALVGRCWNLGEFCFLVLSTKGNTSKALPLSFLTPQVNEFNESPALSLFLFSVPRLWFWIGVSVVTQFICVNGVFRLTGTLKVVFLFVFLLLQLLL